MTLVHSSVHLLFIHSFTHFDADLDDTLYPLSLGLNSACRTNIEGMLIIFRCFGWMYTSCLLRFGWIQSSCCTSCTLKKRESPRCASNYTGSVGPPWPALRYHSSHHFINLCLKFSECVIVGSGTGLWVWQRRVPRLRPRKTAIWCAHARPRAQEPAFFYAPAKNSRLRNQSLFFLLFYFISTQAMNRFKPCWWVCILQIFTNADRAHAGRALKMMGLEECFEGIICFETLNPPSDAHSKILCKPSLEALQAAIEIAGADPAKTVRRRTNTTNTLAFNFI